MEPDMLAAAERPDVRVWREAQLKFLAEVELRRLARLQDALARARPYLERAEAKRQRRQNRNLSIAARATSP